jgi:hypothetical protein
MCFKKKYLSFTICLLSFVSFSQNTDSLKLALKNVKHDTTRCNILSTLAETAPDGEWEQFNEQLKTLAENKIKNNPSERKFYLKHLASALNNFGLIFHDQGDIPKALEFYHKSLKIQEEIMDKKGIAYSLNNIGLVYDEQGEITKALEYAIKSLKIQEEIGEKDGIAYSLNNIGYIYQSQGNFSKGLEYYLSSLKIREEIQDQSGIAASLNNIGGIYDKQFQYAKALEYYKRSLTIQESLGDKRGEAYSLNNLAGITKKNGHLNEASGFAKRGMQIALELGYPENIKNSAHTIKTIYQKQKKYKEAFEMFELEIQMRDSINNQETQKAAIKKQLQYTYEKKELETKAEQDKKDAIAKAELKQKENERNYFIVGFVLVAFLASFILRGYKQKQKANEIIAAQKHLVDEKQKEILDSIHYAKRIQTALMPSEKYIDKCLKQLNKKNT